MSSYILNRLIKDKNYDTLKIMKLKLGLDILIINIPKYMILLLISYYLNILFYTVIMCIVFGILRSTSFGVHASSSLRCLITSLTLFVGGVYLCMYISISITFYLLISILLIISYYKYAPLSSHKYAKLSTKHKNYLKHCTLLSLLFILILAFIINDNTIKNIVLLSSFYQLVSIFPITCKILKRSCINNDLH